MNGSRVLRWCPLIALLGAATGSCTSSAAAQASESANAAPLGAAVVAQYLAELARDSLQPRGTPSSALERAAQYTAAQFARAGLHAGARHGQPWDRDTTWLQRYPLPGQARLDYATASLRLTATLSRSGRPMLTGTGAPVVRQANIGFTRGARYVGTMGNEWADGTVVLVAGPQTPASVRSVDLQGNFVLYVPLSGDTAADAPAREQAVRQYLAAASKGLLLLSTADSTTFAAQVAAAQARPLPLPDPYLRGDDSGVWAVEVWPDLVRAVLQATGVELAEVRAAHTPILRKLPLEVELHGGPAKGDSQDVITAPNVLGTVEGNDPGLWREYVVVMARLDQDGAASASGLAALLTLAEAIGAPEARPRRAVVFVAASGGARGFWGSRYFGASSPLVPALVIGLDARATSRSDSVAAAGLDDVVLGASPVWIAAAQPAWGLTVLDHGSVFGQVSDAGAFARAGVPALAFDVGAAADPEQIARRLQLIFEVIHAAADGPERPRWSASGRQHYLAPAP